MALDRFIISIKGKAKGPGRFYDKPYIVVWAQDETQAAGLRNLAENLMANKGKCGLSETLIFWSNPELSVPENPTDYYDVRVLAKYLDESQATYQRQRSELQTINIPNVSPEITDEQITTFITNMWVQTLDGVDVQLNHVVDIKKNPVNISTDTTTSETSAETFV